MAKHYSSGLVGIDVKTRRPHRLKPNRYKKPPSKGWWLLPIVALTATLGLFLMIVAR